MKKICLCLLFIVCLLNFSACAGKDVDVQENDTVEIIEEFEGKVTYYDKVVTDEDNYLLQIKTNDEEISFAVLSSTEIIGFDMISTGDKVKIKAKREDYNSTYREAIKIKILSNEE